MATSSYTSARALLKEKFALNAKTTQEDLLDDRTCLRYWGQIPMGRVSECLDMLRNIASVKNTKASHSVTNPEVNKEELPGVWRHVQEYALPPRAKTEPDVQDVYQFLKFGWLEAIDWTEARLLNGDNQPLQPNRTLVVRFVNLNYAKLGEMIDGIETTKYITNPVIEGKTYDGPDDDEGDPTDLKWRILSSKPSRADDGSGIITMTLAKNLVISAEALPTPILLLDDKALLSPFAHDTTSVKNLYVWEYRWIDPGYVQTLRDTIALELDVIDAKVIKAEDGSCNIQVQTHTNTWEGNLSQVWEHRNSNPTFAANQVVDTFSHIPLTSLAAFKATLAIANRDYKVSSLIDSTNEDAGFVRIVQTQDKLFVGTVDADNGITTAEECIALLTDGIIRTTLWLGVADDDLAAALTVLATAPSGYTVLRVGHNYSGIGSANITRTMITKGDKTAEQLRIDFPSFEGERLTYHYFGFDKTTADALYITLQTSTDTGYKVDNVSIIEWRSVLAVVQQLSKIQETPFTTSAVRQNVYTPTFGLVTRATTIYLNVPFAEIDTVKDAINALADIIVLDISDDDKGTGSANVTYVWRTKEAAPRSLGAIRSTKSSQFHKESQDRLWIDINLDDKDSLATAVALAMAGTAPYEVAEGAEIKEATGTDAGDKTGHINQHVVVKSTPEPADYSIQDSFNPHGLQEAVMVTSVREYPEIDYDNVGTVFALLRTFLDDPMKGRIQVSLNGNGSFTMRALKEGTPDWDNETPDYVQMGIQNPGVIGEAKTEQATGVPVANAAAIVDVSEADANYALDDIRMTEHGMGEASIEKKQTLKSETAIIIRAFPALGTQRAVTERIWPLVLNANFDTVWTSALSEGVGGDYVLKYRHGQYVGGGMWRISNWVEAATEVEVAAHTAEDTADFTNEVESKQDSDAIPDAENSAGVNVSVSGTRNALNKYDYHESTKTAKSQEVFGSYKDRNGTVYFWVGTLCTEGQYETAIGAAALDSKTDNSVTKSTTQFADRFNYSIIKRPINAFWIAASAASYGPYTEVNLDWNSDRSQYRKKTITFTIYWNTSQANNNADYSGSGPGGWEGVDGNQWMCKKVINITTGSWEDEGSIDF